MSGCLWEKKKTWRKDQHTFLFHGSCPLLFSCFPGRFHRLFVLRFRNVVVDSTCRKYNHTGLHTEKTKSTRVLTFARLKHCLVLWPRSPSFWCVYLQLQPSLQGQSFPRVTKMTHKNQFKIVFQIFLDFTRLKGVRLLPLETRLAGLGASEWAERGFRQLTHVSFFQACWLNLLQAARSDILPSRVSHLQM